MNVIADTDVPMELYPPVDDDGWHSSQVRDWVGVCPELGDSAIRLYLILRSLVIEKRGPVRKLTLFELCHLLPARPLKPGESEVKPSSVSRIRGLLDQLTTIGLVTTPEGLRLTTSSRALAAGRGLRLRINLMPLTSYQGPRNTFDRLDDIRDIADDSARQARRRELDLAAKKRGQRAQEAVGQNSDPQSAGQNSDPRGQNSSPLSQNSDPDLGPDQQDCDLPLSPPAQSFRSDTASTSVRPSVQVADVHARTDGRTDDASTGEEQPAQQAAAGDRGTQPPRRDTTPGMGVLLRVGRLNTDLQLPPGKALTDQAHRLDELIAESEAAGDRWRTADLVTLLGTPLTEPIRRSVSALIAYRITHLPRTPRMAAHMLLPQQASTPGTPADRTVQEAKQVPVDKRAACEGLVGEHGFCDRLALPGEIYCARCLTGSDPLCSAGCGKAVVTPGAACIACQQQSTLPDAVVCPGHGGTPCGRPAQAGGMCGRCRTAAAQARHDEQAEWDRTVAAAAVNTAGTPV